MIGGAPYYWAGVQIIEDGVSGRRGWQDGAGDGCRGSAGRLKRALAVRGFDLWANWAYNMDRC
jgi:hypothetical protein